MDYKTLPDALGMQNWFLEGEGELFTNYVIENTHNWFLERGKNFLKNVIENTQKEDFLERYGSPSWKNWLREE